MKALVTGAAGMLGSWLCNDLSLAGYEVTGVDDYSAQGVAGLGNLAGTSLEFVRSNCMDGALKGRKFDKVFHFASLASPRQYQAAAMHTIRTNTEGTLAMLDLVAQDGVFVYASTSEVYGSPAYSPQSEAYRGNVACWGPRACYDEGKRCGEAICYSALQQGVDARVVRIFNTYGPGMSPYDGRVVVNLLKQALEGKPFTLYGSGQQTRSFCYAYDTVRAIMALADLPKGRVLGPVNVGSPDEVTILELARIIADQFCDGDLVVRMEPLPADDPAQRKPDVARLEALTGWSPEVALTEGLELTMDWLRDVT